LVVIASAITIVPAETLKCFSECKRSEIRFQSWQRIREKSLIRKSS
jgi:hypothetical protein